MTKRRTTLAVAAALLAAGALAWQQSEAQSRVPATVVLAAPARTAPGHALQSRRVVGSPDYQSVAAAIDRPGAQAFREYSDDYVDASAAELAAHLAREKITEAEARELTYFALVAKTSLDWEAVEAATGHPIHPNARAYAQDAMFAASEQMKRELRAEVAAGATAEARAETIARVEGSYLDRYFYLTGMDAELLDWLLWEYVQSRPEEPPPSPDGVVVAPPAGARVVDRKLNELATTSSSDR